LGEIPEVKAWEQTSDRHALDAAGPEELFCASARIEDATGRIEAQKTYG